MIPARALALAIAVRSLLAGPIALAAPTEPAVLYGLNTPPSAFEVGCQGPCACSLNSRPIYGSFELTRTGSDPLFTYYAVDRFIASFNNGPGAVSITGSGQFKIGGEVALQQQLTLDLVIEGQAPQHFDSGLKPVTQPFPRIAVSAAVHGFQCYDTVIVVDAKPAGPSGVSPPHTSTELKFARPSPFRQTTRIVINLDEQSAVDLTVLDLQGRRVRTLATHEVAGPGEQSVVWDGRRDDGRPAQAGLYWIQLRWTGGVDRRRIVKLD